MEPSVLVAGETLVDFIPEESGPLSAVERFDRRAGGAPANVAVRLSQLGRPPWFWTRVGADPFGEFLAETLADRGVPDRFLERDPDAKTTLAFVSHGAAADASFSFYRDGTADTRMEPGRVPDDSLASVEWVYVGGVVLSSEPSRTAVRDLVERANARGASVAVDPNARPELWDADADFGEEVRWLFERCDLAFATPADLREAGFAGEDTDRLRERVHDAGPHTVFFTLGEAGAVASATDAAPWGPARAEHGGYDVDVVDTTGAGDAFVAGVLDALARGERTLADTLAAGNAVAAASTTTAGGMAPLGDVGANRSR